MICIRIPESKTQNCFFVEKSCGKIANNDEAKDNDDNLFTKLGFFTSLVHHSNIFIYQDSFHDQKQAN